MEDEGCLREYYEFGEMKLEMSHFACYSCQHALSCPDPYVISYVRDSVKKNPKGFIFGPIKRPLP